MNETRKRYPADRVKLRELLEKRESEEKVLHAEVTELRARLQEADRVAINASVQMYNLTPEKLEEFLREKFGEKTTSQPSDGTVTPALPDRSAIPAKEAFADEDE